jgi:hypothetical protein
VTLQVRRLCRTHQIVNLQKLRRYPASSALRPMSKCSRGI